MIVDLRSDTVTKPSKEMLAAMMQAEVGDDVFSEDPTIIALENRVAKMFGQEAGLFCASGTMANQIAVKAQTQPMDEIIAHELCHIYYYETAGYAFNSGVSIKLCRGKGGLISAEDVLANIQPDYDWLPKTTFVTIENTCNKAGGTCYDLATMQAVSKTCKKNGLKLHLDGARIWNAMVEMKYQASDFGSLFDSISICFSKGMGAPVGSVLVSDKATIKKARRIRKVFGGGMRQAGILAAACLYSLDHNFELLKKDHQRAKKIGEIFEKLDWVVAVSPIATNIVLFDLKNNLSPQEVIAHLSSLGIKMVQFGPQTIRCVTHLDITDEHINYVEEKLKDLTF
ncbi:MAG: GntG family PLP-dependent aldolase [Chitinophagales bacterium]